MIITDCSYLYELNLPPSPNRSKGLHVSDVLREIAVAYRLLNPDPGFNVPKMCVGLAWEEWLTKRYPWLLFHPGELSRDGIAGSPDAIDQTVKENPVIHEFKFTWYSSNTPIEKFWLYWAQLKSYCCMLGAHRAMLHVHFCNGSYKPPSPQYRVYEAVFSEMELREHWDMILNWLKTKDAQAKGVL